mgnify:CR=1 FL=1
MKAEYERKHPVRYHVRLDLSRFRLSRAQLRMAFALFVLSQRGYRWLDRLLLIRLLSLLSAMSFGVVFVDPANRIIYSNPAFSEVWSIPRDESLLGLNLFDALELAEDVVADLGAFTSRLPELVANRHASPAEELKLVSGRILRLRGLIRPAGRWYAGQPVMITRNDYSLRLFNGDVGLVLPDREAGGELRAFFRTPDGALRSLPPARLPEHETVWATTVHKSQGSEFDRVVLIMPEKTSPVLTRELVYTGVTRARQSLEIWSPADVLASAVETPVRRTSGLRDALWGN